MDCLGGYHSFAGLSFWCVKSLSHSKHDLELTDIHHSSPDPSGMELAQFQYCPITNGVCGVVQHVCPGRRYHLVQHLPCRSVIQSLLDFFPLLLSADKTDDAPRYKRGNRVLLSLAVTNIGLYFFTKAYYVFRNKQRDRKWNSLTEEQQLEYLATTKDEGNKRLDFRFAH